MADAAKSCPKCGARYQADVLYCPKDGMPLSGKRTAISEDPYVGMTLDGQFTIEQLIGIGAMGRVYRAHQRGIDRAVAIKVLHRELLHSPAVIARFHREAKVASRLEHPNVVQVLMTGELAAGGPDVGGEAYMVMEYLDGISLRSALSASRGALPLPRALHVILQVCDAVGEAHQRGIVHRDLKPENVMLVRRGDDDDFAKVLDFGVARMERMDSSIATQAGAVFGTARYISPEGAQGHPVTPAGDVYSIATLLFQCLSGETPFDGDSPLAILVKHTEAPVPDVRSLARASYVPEPIAERITAALSKDPSRRPENARQFGRDLVRAAQQSGLHPDDLVPRSTLLGSARAALQLASLERTKTLPLSAELAQKLGAPLSATEAPGADAQPLEPTLSDDLHAGIRCSATPAPRVDSQHEANDTPHSSAPLERALRIRRAAWIAVSFAVGAGVTLLIAARLGAFSADASVAQSESDESFEIPPSALADSPVASAPEPPSLPEFMKQKPPGETKARVPAVSPRKAEPRSPEEDAGAAPPEAPKSEGRWL